MADKKISELPLIQTISGSTVVVPLVHDGTTIQIPIQRLSLFTSQFSATTGSNTFIGNQIISGNLSVTGLSTLTGNTSVGGDLVVNGKLTAQELFTEITSASIIFESGSTIFGNSADDTHTITGTLILNGLAIGTAQLMAQTASQDGVNLRISSTTGSINATTSSFNSVFLGISSVTGAINTTTSSFDLVFRGISSVTGAINTTTSSFNNVFLGISSVTGAINTTTSSFDNVFLGISYVTGSLNSLTGSYATTGSNTFRGNQSITGSLSISAGEFNVITGSGNMTSSLIFDHTQNDGVTLGLRHNDRLSLADHTFNVNVWAAGVYTTFVRNGTPYSILNVEAFDDNKIYLYRDTRLYNKSLVIDNNLTVQKGVVIGSGSLLVNGVITGSILATNGVISSSNQLFELNAFTGSVIGQTNTISTFTSSVNFTTQSLNTQTGSQDLVNRRISSTTGSINTTTSSFDSVFLRISSITGSINTTTSSFNSVFLGISSVTGAMNTQSSSQNTINFNISVVTSSIDSHILKQSTQTGSQDLVNLGISTFTGSLRSEVSGIEAYTASLKAASIVSSSTQVQNYFTFARTGSSNTFYGNQIITGSLDVNNGITGSFKGNLDGTAAIATLVTVATSATTTDTTLYPAFTVNIANASVQLKSHESGSLYYNGVTRQLVMNDGGLVVSGSTMLSGSTTIIGTPQITGSLLVTGSMFISGSVYGNTTSQSVASNTASLDFTAANFFMIQLGSNVTTHISASNLREGQSVNVLVTTGTNSTASFSTNVRQPSGSFYLPTSGSGRKDILSFVSFDSSNLYLVAVNQMI
jgi:hypothetical protein